jgi:hypothetical protein
MATSPDAAAFANPIKRLIAYDPPFIWHLIAHTGVPAASVQKFTLSVQASL